ncbi:hypothetical protein NLG97_g2790 [Lecanicillium saksenae]|uniref:Uncharacterized protein n=1 Tax=Lecanicillium saksenae TaxID=468837 RepID=A0ACC1R0K4_9HYPO|nr:hypothetical protein NLG97_g2790 [Lecanicillium saksenae]
MSGAMAVVLAALLGHFDKSAIFDASVMTAVSIGLAILLTPLYQNVPREALPRRPAAIWTVILLCLVVLLLQLASIIAWRENGLFVSWISFLASIFSFFGTLGVIFVFNSSYAFAFPPVAFPSIFLASTLPYELAMAQHCLKSNASSILALQLAIIIMKSLAVGVGYVSRSRFFPKHPAASSHQYFLPWSSFTSIPGLRSNFTLEDLPDIPWEDEPGALYRRFCLHFNEADKRSDLALIKATLLTIKPHLVASIPLHLGHIALSLSLPFLVRRVLKTALLEDFSLWSIGLDISGTLFVFLGIGVCIPDLLLGIVLPADLFWKVLKFLSQAADHRATTAARTIYIAAVYDKTTRLNADEIDRTLLGASMSQVMNDVEELLRSARGCVWAGIHAFLGLAFLLPLAGKASFFIVLPMLFVAARSVNSASLEAERRKVYDEKRLSRTKVILSVVAQILNIKMMGLEAITAKYLQREKAAEIAALLQERYSRMIVFVLAAFNHGVTPGFVFGGLIYLNASGENMLGPNVFACFVMMAIIVDAGEQAIDKMTNGSAGILSVERVQNYLIRPEIPDWRQQGGGEDDADDDAEEDEEEGQRHIISGYPRVDPMASFGVDVRSISVASSQGHDILQGLSMQVMRGSVAVVYGTEPYGKSTLARAILGEIPFYEGSVTLGTENVAFCGQDAWVENQTIESNIVGSHTLLRSWYNRVIGACLLASDINRLPERSQTMAGSHGCNLDVSFKQRVALARTIFGRAQLLVLDGVLAAVHPDIARRILQNLFGPNGLVRSWDCTVVLTTSNYQHLGYASVIFEMGEEHKFNCYTDVTRYLRHGNPSLRRQHEQPIYRNADLHATTEARSIQLQLSIFAENDEHSHEQKKLNLLHYFLHPAGLFLIVLFPLAAAGAATMKKMPGIFLRLSLLKGELDEDCLLGYMAFAIGSIVCNRISAGFTEDVPAVSRDLPLLFMQLCFMAATCLLNITIFTATAKYAWLLIAVNLIVLYHSRIVYAPYSQQLRLLERQSIAATAAMAAETVDGIQYIRASGTQDDYMERLHPILCGVQKTFYHKCSANSRLVLIFDIFAALSATFLVVLAHTFPQTSSAAALGLAFTTLLRFSGETTFLIRILSRLDDCLGFVSRIQAFCANTPAESSATSDYPVHTSWPAFGRIDFENVTTNRSDGEGDLLTTHNLEAVNLSLPPMEKAGICAKVGHGQSALFLTLLGLEEYTGIISVDTLDIRSVPSQLLRSRITTITQDGLELHGSVRLNLDPMSIIEPHFSDMDLLNVLERVGLWHIVSKKGGLDTNISLMRFTPVQRQLFGLARAALHRRRAGTNIVLIDKATSNLEGDQERGMQDFMDGEFATCTVITVADRMTAVETADHLCILEAGALKRVLQAHFIDFTEEIVG